MFLKDFISQAQQRLCRGYPQQEARAVVYALCSDMLGTRPYTHVIEPEYVIPEDAEAALLSAVDRLEAMEPLQYVTGKAPFCDLEFRVTPDVLVPRGETQQLCIEAADRAGKLGMDGPAVLDVCTGSGCIAWTLAYLLPGSRVYGCDISEAALAVADSQAVPMREGMRRPVFFRHDLLGDGEIGGGPFDIIVSNPPYVTDSEKPLMSANVLDYEPHLALFVPDSDPLVFYRALAVHSARLLSRRGFGIAEINERFGRECAELFSGSGFGQVSVLKDIHGKDRFCLFAF